MTAPAPQVVAPENQHAEPLDSLEGAGVISSWSDATSDGSWSVASATLDSLGAIADPFQALLSAGAGWLIEHVEFLHEPLDALAGDPTQIRAHARTWANVASSLRDVATDYYDAAGDTTSWTGQGADAYRGAATRFADSITTAAGEAEALSALEMNAGTAVAAERSFIRDTIADFVAGLIEDVITAAIEAPLTFGVGTAATIAWAIGQAVRLAEQLVTRIARLVHVLSEAGEAGRRLAERVRDVAHALGDPARYARDAVQHVRHAAGEVDDLVPDHVSTLVEYGKERQKNPDPS